MHTPLTPQAAALLEALHRRFLQAPRQPAPAVADGHEARWQAQQREQAARERALFELSGLGWPSV
jgi:hypothetical protein